jgi:hypothetical protein
MGLAHLASVLRRDPANRAAAERILSTLLHRNWILPAGAPLKASQIREFPCRQSERSVRCDGLWRWTCTRLGHAHPGANRPAATASASCQNGLLQSG